MLTDAVAEVSVSLDDVTSADPEAESSKIDLVVEMSSDGDESAKLGIADEILLKMELDLACATEKLVNLSVLLMHVESEFETVASPKGDLLRDSVECLEFDLLSRILDSEVTEVDKFMAASEKNIIEAHEMISSYENFAEIFVAMKEKLLDSEKSLRQLQDQVSEIRIQCAEFQRTLSCLNTEEKWIDDKESKFLEDDQFLDKNAKMKMQTAEQQRHILRMLEKSLAREMDLEKKLTESRQIEEELKNRLLSSEFFMEEEAIDLCERWFTAENAAAILMGISQELLSQIKIFQFNLNGSVQREAELRSNLENSLEKLEAKENALQKFSSNSAKLNDFVLGQTNSLKASLTEAEDKLVIANSEIFTLKEKVSSLEKQLEVSESQMSNAKVYMDGSQKQNNASCSEITNMENMIKDLKEELAQVETRAASAEVKCEVLAATNIELNELIGLLKCKSEKVDPLEKHLRESDIRLQQAVASADASQEKENMLYATIRDMENVIEDLKLKVQKAESQADSAEEKCILLSESNAELNEELNILRRRLECLEASLNQAEETKMAIAKDIGFRTKVIADLVMRLAIEREHLHKQVISLALENKTLVKSQQTKKDPFVVTNQHDKGNSEKSLFPEHEVTQIPASGSKLEKTQENTSVNGTRVTGTDSISEPETVRRIDAGERKALIVGVVLTLISFFWVLLKRRNIEYLMEKFGLGEW